MSELHELYTKVPEINRWGQQLGPPLWEALKERWRAHMESIGNRINRPSETWRKDVSAAFEYARNQDKDFGYYVLPRGLMVALRRRDDMGMRWEFRFARNEPRSAETEKAFMREVGIVFKAIGFRAIPGSGARVAEALHGWYTVQSHPRDAGKQAVRLIELRTGEIRPFIARCHTCWEKLEQQRIRQIDWAPGAGIEGQRCSEHMNPHANWKETAKVLKAAEEDPPVDLFEGLAK